MAGPWALVSIMSSEKKKKLSHKWVHSTFLFYGLKFSGPQPFWHQGPVSGKTIVLWTRAGRLLQDDSRALCILCTLFILLLHKHHLRSSRSRSWRLGTPDLNYFILGFPSAYRQEGQRLRAICVSHRALGTTWWHFQKCPRPPWRRSQQISPCKAAWWALVPFQSAVSPSRCWGLCQRLTLSNLLSVNNSQKSNWSQAMKKISSFVKTVT